MWHAHANKPLGCPYPTKSDTVMGEQFPKAPHLGSGLQEASGGEQDEAVQAVGAPGSSSHDRVDEQAGPPQAVPHGPQPVGLGLRLAAAVGLLVPGGGFGGGLRLA